jgi:hypothetical protein
MPQTGIRELMRIASQLPDVVHLEVDDSDSVSADHVIQAADQVQVEEGCRRIVLFVAGHAPGRGAASAVG